MGRIQSNIGLITGVPITETVNQLIAIQARPRDNLEDANKSLTKQQVALTDLTAQLISLQITSDRLEDESLYTQRSITSSLPEILSVSGTGTPAFGNYKYTPVRMVQSHQLLSSRIASDTDPLAAGSFQLGFGGFIDPDMRLDLINQGAGIDRGKIRITDRSGAVADVDLSYAQSVDDVIEAINSAGVGVTASAVGDHLRLTDETGATATNLRVQEVDGGTTAASLGLAGVNVAADTADGSDLLQLFDDLQLARLNQGAGVRFDDILADLQVEFRDGTSLEIDFQKLAVQGTRPRGTTDSVNQNAQITIEAKNATSDYLGVNVIYQNDDSVTKGNESVAYDEDTKTLIFKIDAGQSTANDLVSALTNDTGEAGELFGASLPSGGSGAAVVDAADTATLDGRFANASLPGTAGVDSVVQFTALTSGGGFDDVTIQFVHDSLAPKEGGGVVYDDSDPQNKTLTFTINQSLTTADDVIALANGDATVGQLFHAERGPGSAGTGLIDPALDTAATSGGVFVEAVPAANETTLEDLLATLNAADPARLRAEYTADGQAIRLVDLSTDNGGTFSVASINGSRAAEDLGLVSAAVGDTLDGERLLGGLDSVLLRNLDGGEGFRDLGQITIQDRSGASAMVDLASAASVEDVLRLINDAGVGVSAAVNAARDGIQITDTTGSTSFSLRIANNDASATADLLGIAVDDAVNRVDSGSLRLQTVNENTTLASYNGGEGVGTGSIVLIDSNGSKSTLNITSQMKTIGDVIEEIGRLGAGVEARINDAGNGLLLVDTAGGSGTLAVEAGSGSSAADLHLLGEASEIDIAGVPTQVIDGATLVEFSVDGTESLDDLVERINASDMGVHASLINDGSSIKPYRLSLVSSNAGSVGELRFDTSGMGFDLEEVVAAEDALLLVNLPGAAGSGLLASSTTNTFNEVLDGVTLTINQVSEAPVTVNVEQSQSLLTQNMTALVETYNRVRGRIDELTAFDPETGEKGVLHGDGALLRTSTDLAHLVTSRFFGAGSIQTLSELGVTLGTDGKLTFNESEFKEKYRTDADGVRDFLASPTVGASAKLHQVLEQLSGAENSVLTNRTESISTKISNNAQRIEFLTARLERSRERLELDFYRMELSIAKIQTNLSSIQSLRPLPPL